MLLEYTSSVVMVLSVVVEDRSLVVESVLSKAVVLSVVEIPRSLVVADVSSIAVVSSVVVGAGSLVVDPCETESPPQVQLVISYTPHPYPT